MSEMRQINPSIISADEEVSYDLNILPSVIADCIDREYIRLVTVNPDGAGKSVAVITNKLLGVYFNKTRFAMFTSEQLGSIQVDTFSNVDYRDWILSLTLNIRYTLDVNSIPMVELIDIISKSFYVTSKTLESKNTFTPIGMVSQLMVDGTEISDILLDNPWLVTIFLISQYLDNTIFYSDFLQKIN